MPSIAIIGRPNVGKSTLFNRLVGKKQALVHDLPGVTRDRKQARGSVGPLDFDIIDTPGLEEAAEESLEALMTGQSLAAIDEADVLLFVIDAKDGLTPQDEHFALLARKSGKPVVLVANKAEAKDSHGGVPEACALGFDEPVAISAEHGLGMAELYDALAPLLEVPDTENPPSPGEGVRGRAETCPHPNSPPEGEGTPPLRITVLGRPNVGKSTLINRILGEERVLTGPYAGMTRDAIELPLRWQERDLLLVDTAGMRRKARVTEQLERMAVKDTTTALQYAEVAILVLDATIPLEKQDNTLAGLIEREGRACVIALNKWDLVEGKKALLKELPYRLEEVMPRMRGIAIIPLCALTGSGVEALMEAAFTAHDIWNIRLPTGELNRWLEAALERHAPPLVKKRRFKIRYITQSKARPPTFILFVNRSKDAPEDYIRYLSNSLRDTFRLPGVPLRLLLRTGKNPYAGE